MALFLPFKGRSSVGDDQQPVQLECKILNPKVGQKISLKIQISKLMFNMSVDWHGSQSGLIAVWSMLHVDLLSLDDKN